MDIATRTLRIVDLMCDWHRTLISRTRLWPIGYIPGNHDRDGNNSCHQCAEVGRRQPSGRWQVLPDLDPRQAAAIHEAGHVVAYLHLGICVAGASLTPSDGNEEWSTAHVTMDYRPGQAGTIDDVVGLWAGQSASLCWLAILGDDGPANWYDAIVSSENDCQKIANADLRSDNRMAARDRADELVARHWDAVERVAAALLDRTTLNAAELHDLVSAPDLTTPAEQPMPGYLRG